ncbi:hypothetical protein RB195_017513 [Necator americanus]|uniref:Uncharacterized protein n=1 Tax=Necator americanus TaxID=51031 RepID=A0ABR1C824_NECAM
MTVERDTISLHEVLDLTVDESLTDVLSAVLVRKRNLGSSLFGKFCQNEVVTTSYEGKTTKKLEVSRR